MQIDPKFAGPSSPEPIERSRPAMAMDSARIARVRGRVLSGAYDTLEIVDAIARRLLDSGDL